MSRTWSYCRVWATPTLIVIRFGLPTEPAYLAAAKDLGRAVGKLRLSYDKGRREFSVPPDRYAAVVEWVGRTFEPSQASIEVFPNPETLAREVGGAEEVGG